MQFGKKMFFLFFLGFVFLLSAGDVTEINLPSGDIEDVDVAAASKTNRWGALEFRSDGWGIADEKDTAQGKKTLVICNMMVIHADIPAALRGQSLELSFLAKGDCSLWFWTGLDLTTLVEKVTDARGNVVRVLPPVKPIYNNFLGWDKASPRNYPAFTEFRIFFPPLSPETTRIAISLCQDTRFHYKMATTPRKLYVDNIRLKAYRVPFYRETKTVPFLEVDSSFETSAWKFNAAHVGRIQDTADGKRKIALKKGADLHLDLPLQSLKGKSLGLSLRAKGSGKLDVSLDMGSAGKTKKTLETPLKLDSTELPKLIWFSEIRSDADSLKLQIDTEDSAVLSDLKLFVSEKPLVPYPRNLTNISGEKLPESYIEGRFPSTNGLVDIAPLAEMKSLGAYEFRRNTLTDGSLGSGTKEPVEFRFNEPIGVSEIRLTLPPSCILLYADTKGDGNYDTVISEVLNGLEFNTWGNLREYVWFRRRFEKPLRLYGIKYIGGGHEFQILASRESAAPLLKKKAKTKLADAAQFTLGETITIPEASMENRLRFGFTLEPWMFDIPRIMENYYRSKTPMPSIRKWAKWRRILEDYKKLQANFILLFPPHTAVIPPGAKVRPGPYPAPVMWPSNVWYLNQPFNLLKEMNSSCRENGILNFVIPREWLFKDGLKNGQIEFAGEIAAQGAAGIPVCMDEQLIQTGHNPEGMPRVQRADTLRVREGHLKRLEEIASYMRTIKENAVKINPEALTFGGFIGPDYYRDRLGIVSPHDAWGFQGKTDVIGGDGTYFGIGDPPFGSYAPAVACAGYAALSPGRRVMATNNFNWGITWNHNKKAYDNPLVYDDYPMTALYGGALSCYFNKAEFLNFWRYNFMDEKGGPPVRKAVEATGKMVAALSAWGGKKATVPKDVLLLRSRTSEDWWYLKYWWKQNKPGMSAARKSVPDGSIESAADKKNIREQGFTQFNWCITQLISNSVPNEIYMMNQLPAWKEIAANYKVILIPFPYAVSAEAAEVLKKAADSGVSIIALSGCGEGPVNDLGEAHAGGPILKKLIEEGRITVFSIDVIGEQNTEKLEDAFRKLLFERLARKGGPAITMERNWNHDIQSYMLEVSPVEKLVLLINYSERESAVNLGLNLPAGRYRMEVCSPELAAKGLVNGKEEFSAEELKKIRIGLPKEDTKILRIYQKEK